MAMPEVWLTMPDGEKISLNATNIKVDIRDYFHDGGTRQFSIEGIEKPIKKEPLSGSIKVKVDAKAIDQLKKGLDNVSIGFLPFDTETWGHHSPCKPELFIPLEKSKGDSEMNEEYTYTYKINVKWDDRKAENTYTFLTYQESPNGEREIYSQLTGDADWAKRIADHYGIEVPTVEVAEDEK